MTKPVDTEAQIKHVENNFKARGKQLTATRRLVLRALIGVRKSTLCL